MNKSVYALVHDTNSGLSTISSAQYYIKKCMEDPETNIVLLDKAIERLISGREKIKNSVDEYYKTLKND